jgi:hypothetical protein
MAELPSPWCAARLFLCGNPASGNSWVEGLKKRLGWRLSLFDRINCVIGKPDPVLRSSSPRVQDCMRTYPLRLRIGTRTPGKPQVVERYIKRFLQDNVGIF